MCWDVGASCDSRWQNVHREQLPQRVCSLLKHHSEVTAPTDCIDTVIVLPSGWYSVANILARALTCTT